jgi:hypothetical protein
MPDDDDHAIRPCDRGKEHVVDMKLELVAVPVSDVDHAKAFYTERCSGSARTSTPG